MTPKEEYEATCRICGRVFLVPNRYRYSYCSEVCRTTGKSLVHRNYARRNRAHLTEYARQRYARIWGHSSRKLAAAAELFALNELLPYLGYTKIFHVSPRGRFVPFDFVATRGGVRVLIDVTTAMNKGGRGARSALDLARALRMPFLRVFIKPDFSGYMVRDAFEGGTVLLHKVTSFAE